jgi:hypothetical protein
MVVDNLAPEDAAMLQALYSRSPASVTKHLAKVAEVGSGKFMDTYYVGYGHASIGDCGVTSLFVEDVSMLVAKAIQDWPLYSGQEASTRYMDFSKAVFESPLGGERGVAVQERWRTFYLNSMSQVREHIGRQYPRRTGEDASAYANAVKARAFDIMRAFLPAGAHTNLSWTTNLRQAGDKLAWLTAHSDHTAARVGMSIEATLRERYPHSFREQSPAEIAYRCAAMLSDYYFEPDADFLRFEVVVDDRGSLDDAAIRRLAGLFRERPRGVTLPHWTAEIGTITSEFLLDFGSFRDLQRHRNGTVRMPLLTTDWGFEPWYLEQLPDDLRDEAQALLVLQEAEIKALSIADDAVRGQNYVAMGYRVPCRVTQSLPAFVYRLELRSGKTIHPTLRKIVHEEIGWLRTRLPNIALHVDMDPDSWTVRRGTQTITEK